ncbi:MAG: helix-turn-helix transcriptional regulator [Candidatus Limiplasma sp.]|nr:helix-turn-helix transcriptional regulator [Candidatus Limiplasma sp.]
MEENELAQRARYIHYTTRLPVFWLRDGSLVNALPHAIQLAGTLLNDPTAPLTGLKIDRAAQGGVAPVENAYAERFFYAPLGEGTLLLCGPYCPEPFTDGDVQRLIRSLRLPLDKREQLHAYYAGLPRLNDMHAYYTGLFLQRTLTDASAQPGAAEGLPSDEELARRFEQNAYRNRMAMYQHPPYFFEQEITRQIIGGDREQAMQTLAELNRLTRATLADNPLRSLKNSLIASVTLFTRAAITGGVPSDEAFTLSDSFIQTIEKQSDLRFLSTIEEQIILRFIDRVERHRTQRYSRLVRSAIAYIEQRLSEPLDAPAIAGHVYVHPDYLSRRFRQETGEALHSFILRRRVEEAARFMRYGNDSIPDIAAFYQFSSQSHFTTVFKRYMDCTPQQYRNL